ncbi:hypothetical protein RhiJN_12471 [Ceratobasidium sp. AG-Ba]|nr:hypothetical protein RhiJN_12471 [Ceratobasidium sp. AG-Ba]
MDIDDFDEEHIFSVKMPECSIPTKFEGVYTNRDLQQADLAILLEYRVLVCLKCTDEYGFCTIHPEMALKHVKSKHNPLNDHSINDMVRNLAKNYCLPRIPPPPKQIVAPFPFLGMSKHKPGRHLQVCTDCPATRRIGWLTESTRKWHYFKTHPKLPRNQRNEPKPVDAMQSWYHPKVYRQHFEVDESLTVTHSFSSAESAKKRQAAATAYRNARKIDQGDNTLRAPLAKDTALHIAEQDWATFFDGKDADSLVDIVELPSDPADPLFRLRELSGEMFVEIDKMLSQTNSKFLELAVDARTDGSRTFPFGPIGKCSQRRYAQVMTRFLAALVRTASTRSENDNNNIDPKTFVPYLTSQQELFALELGELLTQQGIRAKQLKPAIQSLLVSCFAPGAGLPDDCEYMCNNKYHDFVHTFCGLSSVNRNGTFKEPEQIVPVTTALQYIIRLTILMEVPIKAKIMSGTASAFEQLSYFLKRNKATPFGCLQTLRTQMLYHERSTRRRGKLQWAGKNSEVCHFSGADIPMDALKKLAHYVIDQVKEKLDLVLRGIALDELEALLPEAANLYDNFTDTSPGYSFLTDKRNTCLTDLARKLEHLFITREDLTDDFWDGQTCDTNGSPAWYDSARKKWLQDVSALSDALAVAMHIWGGQPARGTEFHNLCYCNPALSGSRQRNIFYFDKRLVYVLWYCKFSRMTGTDHAAVHALPDNLSRLAIITMAVVFPLATRWTEEIYGCHASELQKTHMFCKLGKVMKPQTLSHLLTIVTEKILGVKLGLRAFRHFIIAVQREHLIVPSHFVATNIFQRQARHSHRVSHARYAIQTEEAAFTESHTFKTFVQASVLLHDWFNSHDLSKTLSPSKRKHHQISSSTSQRPQNIVSHGPTLESEDEMSENDVDEDVEDAYSDLDSDME